jgi:hypothetical protein
MSMRKINIKVGGSTIQLEEETDKKLIKSASFWEELPKKCPMCSSEVGLFHRYAVNAQTKKGGDFFGLRCKGKTIHEVNFGQHNNQEGTLFYKHEWKDAYNQGGSSEEDGPGY